MAELDGSPSDSWWKFLAIGVLVLALVVVVTTLIGELPDGWWEIGMAFLLFSVLSIAAGLVLGGLNLLRRHSAS